MKEPWFPKTHRKTHPIRHKLVAYVAGKKYDADTAQARESLPRNAAGEVAGCIDWYLVTYNVDTEEIISELYLYPTSEANCDKDSRRTDGPGPAQIYTCASSFNFQLQGQGSITNEAKTWELVGYYVTSQSAYITIFGIATYAPTDIRHWGNAWFKLNCDFNHLVQSGDVWLQPDKEGLLHLRLNAFAQQQIAASASDYASSNSRNPKNVLTQSGGSNIYKKRFRQLFTDYMRSYNPGTSVQILNVVESGCTIAMYSRTPC